MSGNSYQVLMQHAMVSAVGSRIGNRIYLMRAPQGSPSPYVLHRTITHTEIGHLRGSSNLENPRVRVEVYAENYEVAKSLEKAIHDALLGAADFSAVYIFSTEVPEDETQLFHLVSEYSVWHSR